MVVINGAPGPTYPHPLKNWYANQTTSFEDFRAGEVLTGLAPGAVVRTTPLNHHADGATGYRIEDADGAVLAEAGEAIGVATNNVAEYRALIAGLEAAAGLGAREVEVRADSQLLLRQMTGAYRVKNAALQELWLEARRAAGAFVRVRYVEIPRGENAAADLQVNLALDAAAP